MGWVIKMLLKLFKPFAKIMILQAIIESLSGMMEEETTESAEDPTETESVTEE